MAKSLRGERQQQSKFTGAINDEALRRRLDVELAKRRTRREINEELTENHAAVKAMGVSVPVFLGIVREMEMDADERAALYVAEADLRQRLGAFAELPLGAAAVQRAESEQSDARADAMAQALREKANAHGKRRKPFAEQRVGRPRGRQRNGAAPVENGQTTVDQALDRARHHLGGEDDLPPAA